MKKVENDTGFVLGENPKDTGKVPNTIGLYQKCLECRDYGVVCNGPKLAALGDIMVVREFHRAIKDKRGITLKLIALAAPTISEYTVQDYFSNSAKDFKWTTVAAIDNALTAICGNRIGQPPLDHPCPATSSEIRQQKEEAARKLADAKAECRCLQGKLAEAKENHIDQMNDYRKDQQKRVDFLKDLAETRYQLILHRDRKITALTIIIAVLFALLSFYLVWDIMHPGVGLFRW